MKEAPNQKVQENKPLIKFKNTRKNMCLERIWKKCFRHRPLANNAHHLCVGQLDRFPASLEASGLVKLTKAGSPYLDFNNGRAAQLPAV